MNFHFQKKKKREGRKNTGDWEEEFSIEIWEMGFQETDEKKKRQEDGHRIMEEVQKTRPSHVWTNSVMPSLSQLGLGQVLKPWTNKLVVVFDTSWYLKVGMRLDQCPIAL